MSNETTKPVNAGFAKILPVMFAFFVMEASSTWSAPRRTT